MTSESIHVSNPHQTRKTAPLFTRAGWIYTRRFSGDVAANGIMIVIWWSCVAALCAILVSRPIGAAWDDFNYLKGFAPRPDYYGSWWHFLIEEPGWNLITSSLSVFGAETAFRVVLLCAPAIFFVAANRIAGGSWIAVGWWSWLILALFLIDGAVGTGLYVGAVRQGLATSVFLILVAARVHPTAAAAIAGTVHSAFFPIAAVIALSQFIHSNRNLTVAVVATLAIYAILLKFGLAPSPFENVDLGRRTTTYTLTSGLNLVGYASLIAQFAITLWLTRELKSPWVTASLIFLLVGLALSVANAGFVRIFLTLHVFVLLILIGIKTRREMLALAFWVVTVIGIALWTGQSDTTGHNSWLGQWSLVLRR